MTYRNFLPRRIQWIFLGTILAVALVVLMTPGPVTA